MRYGKLVYVGSVGTGFKRKEAYRLRELLDLLKIEEPAVASTKRVAIYAEPTLLAEVEFVSWTTDNKLRHPSFKGLRDPADDPKVFAIED
jgi:bifunctional non-homologous end joining protein LigD